jgi:hypothetical protein
MLVAHCRKPHLRFRARVAREEGCLDVYFGALRSGGIGQLAR